MLQSDLFASLGHSRYDLIYWNLPYHREPAYLQRLFADAPGYLAPAGELVVGYNAVALPRQRLLAILARQRTLQPAELRSWRRHRHEIMVIRKRSADAAKGAIDRLD